MKLKLGGSKRSTPTTIFGGPSLALSLPWSSALSAWAYRFYIEAARSAPASRRLGLAEVTEACFIVRDHNGQTLAHVYFRVWAWPTRRIRLIDSAVTVMRFLIALLALIPTCALAQRLPVEDRACITAAANKLPPVTALGIKGSRALPQPQQSKGRSNPDVYRVTVEIDVSVAGQSSTYVFNCVRDGQLTVIQPLGMR
jgi:hypothetical protein